MVGNYIKKLTAHYPILKSKRIASLIAAVVIVLVMFYVVILKDLPNPSGFRNYKAIPVSTQVMDRNGKLLYAIFRKQNRVTVKLFQLPPYIKQATIAIEDKDFYKHGGVSIIGGMLRAVKDMVLYHKLQGGSTLTQQLVKSAFLSPQRTVLRKVKEIVLALWTEQIFTKDEILELYLNQVPYGGVSYGIEEAALTYFDKSAKDLSLAQAAFLAGLPQAPTLYSPYTNLNRALNRQREVLKRMEELKYISHDQRVQAESEHLEFVPPTNSIRAPHFVFYVKDILEQKYGIEAVEEGGLKVYTSLDSDIQASSEAILKDELDKVKKLQVSNGAVLVTRPATGEILSMVGSVDFFATSSGSFNVTTALRQPGSSIKPINYAIGLERKLVTPATIFLDMKTCFQGETSAKSYCPVNYDNTFHGPVQLRYALANSYNIPAVKMLALNGVSEFVASSSSFLMTTFTDPKRYGLSLTLGGGEVRMTEMSQAFSSFANEGVPKELVSILKVVDKNNNAIYEYKDSNYTKDIVKRLSYPNFLAIQGKKAISKETAFLISNILSDNGARSAAFGSSSQLVIPNHTVAVKTGTTNDKRDNWTIGYTPNFLVTVWVGNNDNSPMNPYLTSGVTGAAPIWNRIMRMVLKNQSDLKFRQPEGVVGRKVCSDTGSVVNTSDPNAPPSCPTRFEFIAKGTEGIAGGLSVSKEQVSVNKDTGAQAVEGDTNVEMQEKTLLKDKFSSYCVDCAHPEIVTPTPMP